MSTGTENRRPENGRGPAPAGSDSDGSGPPLVSAGTQRLLQSLKSTGRRRVPLPQVWQAFAACDAAAAAEPDRRSVLGARLAELAATGLLAPAKDFDRGGTPALPLSVLLPADGDAAPRTSERARAVAWRPELAWAATARLTPVQLDALVAVNVWLRERGGDTDTAPTRERSLEIFGAEKQLDALLGTSVFAPDRLTVQLLRTFRSRPPLAARRLGDGPVLLVVENSDTFTTLHAQLLADPGRVGWIAWGAGNAFTASVAGTADLDGVTDIRYFGDVDAEGLQIPAAATSVAADLGLPAVLPAPGLYEVLFDVAAVQKADGGLVPEDVAESLSAWLGEALQSRAAGLLATGNRIAQEWVNGRVLSTHESWRAGLT